MAERQFGPYRLVRQIAVGGMAEIHLAKTKGIAGFEKYVALKMIHPNLAEDEQFIQMLVDEAKIAVQLTHANIAQTFDLGRVGDTYYITMEYVDGSDLYKVLRRASEVDLEMPLDICAFIGKEVTSALDHAHRKRDHAGTALGIVHRDVSPQNVLVSYAGEVKLVDFGIAKATSKAKQTAVGVIKGKYYYMSPEQAWGDPIDHRSDIFSAGIVLYELMTGQMLYLEEDLHRLLDMVRKADIAPPSRLRKGIPPQLERIVMHALAKMPGERYQSAGDFATDLERFLHAYSPVFTAAKVANILRQVIGEPAGIAEAAPEIEVRSGQLSTQELRMEDLAHAGDELRDENSVIFRMDQLQKPVAQAPAPSPARAPTRQPTAIPSIKRPASGPQVISSAPAPSRIPSVKSLDRPRTPTKPRQSDEETREMSPLGLGLGAGDGDSGLLTLSPPAPAPRIASPQWDAVATQPGDDDLENIGERTMITAPDFLGGARGDDLDDGGDATMISSAPTEPDDEPDYGHETISPDDDGPTVTRDFTRDKPGARVLPSKKAPGPAALAAKIHAPAVSALRTPRPSRRTPPNGIPQQGNVLQSIVQSQPSEAMPSGGRPRPATRPPPIPPAPGQPMAPPPYTPHMAGGQPVYESPGTPLGLATPQGIPMQSPGVPPHMQPYAQMQGYDPAAQSGQPPQYQQYPQHPQHPQQLGYQQHPQYQQYPPGYPQHPQPYSNMPQHSGQMPGALYQLNPYGAPPPQPMSLTGQFRLFAANDVPQLDGKRRWVGVVIAGIVAIAVAAGVTFFIIRATRDSAPTVASIKVESSPPGAEVSFDGTRLPDRTPLTIENVPVGSHHDLKIELPLYNPYIETVEVPRSGASVPVMALLKRVTGKIVVLTKPDGAEIRINGELRGRSPMTISDVDMASARTIEVRLKDYQPVLQDLKFPANGQIVLDLKLEK